MSRAARIAELNDLFRETILTGRVVLTIGIQTLPDHLREEVITRFNAGNDPHGKHDFVAPEVGAVGKMFRKIDYYDEDY